MKMKISQKEKLRALIQAGGYTQEQAREILRRAKKRTYHNFEDRKDGLAVCTICKGAEGALPDDCPGRVITAVEAVKIFDNKLNFSGGEWHQEPARYMHLMLDLRKEGTVKVSRPSNAEKILDRYREL